MKKHFEVYYQNFCRFNDKCVCKESQKLPQLVWMAFNLSASLFSIYGSLIGVSKVYYVLYTLSH